MPSELFYRVVVGVLTGLIGLCVGSFLNVVVYRVPEGMSLARPASHCPKCGYQLKWYDNIPVISYLILGGKCRNCKEHISFRYTAVELANCLLWLICAARFWEESVVYSLVAMAVCSVCLCIFCIDLEHMIIPDRFQIALALLGIVALFFDRERVWWSHLAGLGGAAVLFLGIFLFGEFVLKKELIGGGDIKLMMGAGLLLGWEKLILTVLLSSVAAAIVLLIVRLAQKDGKGKEYPFGPFITAAIMLAMLYGENIISWYTGLFL